MLETPRICLVATLGLTALGIASPAAAAPPLYSPWPCGVEEDVTQGTENTADGASHRPGSSDAFAWDFGRGEGDPVVAPFDGIVRSVRVEDEIRCKSCELCDPDVAGDCDNCGCWPQTNHVVIAFDDGTEAQLMHLKAGSSSLEVGDVVRRGQTVASVGLSGQITGAHLHYHVQECTTEGNWYCASIETSFVDIGFPDWPDKVTSRNCLIDDQCIVDESATLDDTSPCFIDAAGSETWQTAGDYQYVPNTNTDEPTAAGHWRFRVAETGVYQVEVLMPQWGTLAGSSSVTYEVGSGTRLTEVVADQRNFAGQWGLLGELFVFREETESYVKLSNVTGEPTATTYVGYDQIRLTRMSDYMPSHCGVVGEGVEIDDDDPVCFARSGTNWFELEGGRDGFQYSNSNALSNPLEVGSWTINAGRTETYEIWVYVPAEAETRNAQYHLSTGYLSFGLDAVDQSAGPGWVKLVKSNGTEEQQAGQFKLYAGLPATLSLGDATGEPFVEGGDNTIVAYDAIAVAPASIGFDPSALGDKGDDLGPGLGDERGLGEEGCACRVGPTGSGAAGSGLMLLVLVGLRRRRRGAHPARASA